MGNLSSERSSLHERQWIFLVPGRINELLGTTANVGTNGKRTKRTNRIGNRFDTYCSFWRSETLSSLQEPIKQEEFIIKNIILPRSVNLFLLRCCICFDEMESSD